MNLCTRLQEERILLFDGGMGTMLQAHGWSAGPMELANREQPDLVRDLHRQYLAAGAEVVETNSFGGNPIKLSLAGLAEQMEELNRAAARLAREAVETYAQEGAPDHQAFVVGSMGPTGKLLEPYGELSFDAAVEAFAQQAEALAAGGVDALLVETMSDLQELRAALTGAAVTGLPLLATLTFEPTGRTTWGVTPAQAAAAAKELGAVMVGINCGAGPQALLPVVEALVPAAAPLPVLVQPNAGLPRLENGLTVYPESPEEFARGVAAFLDKGARALGGCCGTTPAHIAALREILASQES